jgi:hypothetical protein
MPKLPSHPLSFIPSRNWGRAFWILLGMTVLLSAVFAVTGAPLTTDAAPYGIVSYELAGTPENARRILASWDAETQLRAAFGLGLDYLFMVVYASTIALGSALAARQLRRAGWPLARWGTFIAWGAVLAALLDATENIALLTLLWGTLSAPWPALARWCAIPKFALIFLGLVYVIYGGAAWLASKMNDTPTN